MRTILSHTVYILVCEERPNACTIAKLQTRFREFDKVIPFLKTRRLQPLRKLGVTSKARRKLISPTNSPDDDHQG
jgi:hypothetical protein